MDTENNCRVDSRAGYILGQPNFFGILESNSTSEFGPNRDSIPIFGSLGYCFTTQELRSRPFISTFPLKWPTLKLSWHGKTMS